MLSTVVPRQVVIRWATEVVTRAQHWNSLGYSIHHELLRSVASRFMERQERWGEILELSIQQWLP
jgi:hypothetical protein